MCVCVYNPGLPHCRQTLYHLSHLGSPIYIYEYYSDIKKNEIVSFAATWMDPETVTLSEVNQTEKEKYHMASLIRGI